VFPRDCIGYKYLFSHLCAKLSKAAFCSFCCENNVDVFHISRKFFSIFQTTYLQAFLYGELHRCEFEILEKLRKNREVYQNTHPKAGAFILSEPHPLGFLFPFTV
jgi:hypothetical protein